MGAVAVDISNPVEVGAVGFRALNDALGADGARVFIHYFVGRVEPERPRVTAAQVSEILEQSMARALERQSKGSGDFTAEKYNRPERPFEETAASQQKIDAMTKQVKLNHPEYTAAQVIREVFQTVEALKLT